MKLKTILISASLLFAAQGAFATPYSEVGDAGDSLGGSQAVGAGTTSITGTGDNNDVDMYSFIWGGGGLTIDTFAPAFQFDTQLWLFDSGGNGVLSNDDHSGACAGSPSSGLQSCLDLSAGLGAGTYYLAISDFNNDPIGSTCGIPEQCTWNGLLTGWGASGTGSEAYSINFSAATGGGGPMPTPEPGILVLLGLGLAGLGFARRRA